ncbi:tetratricopeptide repeat protein [Aureimonas leprariae]|uniref:Tetratricopeptide repeat protein n=1 Tax=Plantimonas leprariae TaxID=2615207 RepID=A0A7V7PLM5_9HYPH|nr:hypothetical protein [Aureimonas leprariae]KAB0677372.1 hypothetical protein F6X38_18445 [Aureimonas leprariae]
MDEEEPADELHARVTQFSESGNLALEAGEYDRAIAAWRCGLSLLPQPRAKWEATLWLEASIGEAFRAKGDVETALDHFANAYRSADGATNPFVRLRLGTCYADLGRADAAAENLLYAYMLEGEEIFADDRRYLDILRERRLLD